MSSAIHHDVVTAYYSEATADYLAWSRGGNMHFGFWRRGLSPLDAESMIEQMNTEVISRLALPARARVADLGCGMGATSRALAERGHRAVGVTLLPSQARTARERTARGPLQQRDGGVSGRASFVAADYARAPFLSGVFDGALCLESAAHDAGQDKVGVVAEAARLLKPGARFVVADAFLKRRPLSPLTRAATRLLERMWAVPHGFAHLQPFVRALRASGFCEVRVDDVSWRVAPTVLRAPIVSSRFLVAELSRGRRLSAWRWKNALAAGPLLFSTVDRTAFAYCIITATRAPADVVSATGAR